MAGGAAFIRWWHGGQSPLEGHGRAFGLACGVSGGPATRTLRLGASGRSLCVLVRFLRFCRLLWFCMGLAW